MSIPIFSICIYTCVYIYRYAYNYIFIHMHTHTHTHTHTHIYIYVFVYAPQGPKWAYPSPLMKRAGGFRLCAGEKNNSQASARYLIYIRKWQISWYLRIFAGHMYVHMCVNVNMCVSAYMGIERLLNRSTGISNIYIYEYTHIYIYMYMCAYMYIYIYLYVYIYIYIIYVYVCVCIQIYIYIYISSFISVDIVYQCAQQSRVHMYVCIYTYCVRIYIYWYFTCRYIATFEKPLCTGTQGKRDRNFYSQLVTQFTTKNHRWAEFVFKIFVWCEATCVYVYIYI